VGNSCKLEKFYFLAIISKMMWNFGFPSAPVYGDRGSTERLQKVEDFLQTFPPEGAKVFHRGPSEGPLEIYHLFYGGATCAV